MNYNNLNQELSEAGINNHSDSTAIEYLVNSSISVKPYIAILTKYLDQLNGNELELVVRALSEKGLKNVSNKMIKLFLNYSEDYNIDLWVVGNAICIIDDKSTYNDVLQLCKTKDFGSARQMLMTSLRRMKTEESFKVLINSLEDDSIRGHAIDELRKWGDSRALVPIEKTTVKEGLFEAKAKKKAIKKLKKG